MIDRSIDGRWFDDLVKIYHVSIPAKSSQSLIMLINKGDHMYNTMDLKALEGYGAVQPAWRWAAWRPLQCRESNVSWGSTWNSRCTSPPD